LDHFQLRAFVAVAEIGKLTIAAERLFLSQPTLTRHIQALETELGTPLFERLRGRRPLVLTEAGSAFLLQARVILSEVDRARAMVEEIRLASTGAIRIAASPARMRALVVPAFIAFNQTRPDQQIHLIEADYGSEFDFVDRGTVDLAVGTPVVDMPNIRWDKLYESKFYALVTPGHRFASRAFVDIEELAEEHLLLHTHGKNARASFEFVLHIDGLLPQSVFESQVQETVLSLAEVGFGVALVVDSVPLSGYKLEAIPVLHHRRQIKIQRAVAWHRNRPLSTAAQEFIFVLKQEAANRSTDGYTPWLPTSS
jgi:DNA-binding transcriptional LysR family regulator